MLTRIKKIHDDLLLGLDGRYSWKLIFKAAAFFWATYLFVIGSATGNWAPSEVWIFLAGIVLGIQGMQEMSNKYPDRRFGNGWWKTGYPRGRNRRQDSPDDPEDPNLKNEPGEI